MMEAMLTDNKGHKISELEGAIQATLLRKACCKISTRLAPSWNHEWQGRKMLPHLSKAWE